MHKRIARRENRIPIFASHASSRCRTHAVSPVGCRQAGHGSPAASRAFACGPSSESVFRQQSGRRPFGDAPRKSARVRINRRRHSWALGELWI
jgi:hypothetical protein